MHSLQQPSFGDAIRLRGDLLIQLYDVKTQRRIKRFVIKNTITYNGLGSVIRLWAQDAITAADWQIATLRVGSNATPPTHGDTGLGAPISSIILSSGNRVQSLPTGELIIQAQIAPADLVGSYLREAGLFFTNSSMLSRQVHPEIFKTAAFTVSYTWRLGVVAI